MPCISAHFCEPALVICCGVRIPATTSSPCALTSHSPLKTSSPVAASRLKQTPVADVLPMLPNTIAITETAVPHSAGIPSILRYRIARSFIQLSNTAHIAPHSCSIGSFGKSLPVCSFIVFLNRVTSFFNSSVVNSLSSLIPLSAFTCCIIDSKGSMSSFFVGFIPKTTSPYICTKRRYAS